jgi:hypothetical protein
MNFSSKDLIKHRLSTKLQFVFCGLLTVVGILMSISSSAQADERFGQNRVQYKDFTFQYYESDNFITYFYMGGQDIAKYVIKAAEDNSEEISKLLDFRYKRKIDVIVYNNINELNQTNIGIYEPNQNPGGTINIPDSKMFVYFNGDHANLDKQIREGIARIYIDKMVRGSSAGESIQNAVLLNLPHWYRQGLIQYFGQNWNSDLEDRLRDGILNGRFKKLRKLQPEEAAFVGQSIWHYIEEVHGKSALSNIIYLSRINRSVDNGFMFVLGTDLSETLQAWYTYYVNRFNNEAKITSMPSDSSIVKTRIKKNLDYYQPRISSDGKYIAYASNDMGRYKIHLLNTQSHKKAKVIFRAGWRTNTLFTDQSIPLLAWDPSGKKLAFINDKRSNIFIRFYDVEKKKMEKNPVRKFQKVVSFNYMDSKQLVMSAIQNGQTDVYLYNIASTTTRKITDDYFDDLYPAYINADSIRGIMFASNRKDDTLRPQRYESQVIDKDLDLFFYDLDANQNVLYRVTQTPLSNESYPQNLNDSLFTFLSEENGIRNRHIGHFESVFDHDQKTLRFTVKETGELDSIQVAGNTPSDLVLDKSSVKLIDSTFEKVYKVGGVTAPYTNYNHNIREQNIIPQRNIALDLFKVNNKPQFRKYDVGSIVYEGHLPTMENVIQSQRSAIELNAAAKKESAPAQNFTQTYDSVKANKGNRPFDLQSEFDYGIKLFDWDSVTASKLSTAENGYVFRFSKVRPYFVRFEADKVIAQLDNNILINRYQPFDPSNPYYRNAPVSFMIKFGITDLLENHKIYGGLRLPFAGISNNSEYFITYENLTKRLDQKYTFYRRAQAGTATERIPFLNQPVGDQAVDYSIKTNYAEVQLSYPFDVLNSLRFTFAFRNDKIVLKSQDSLSRVLPSLSDNWLIIRPEYVFDNCMEVATNIRYGTRFKVFAEVQKEFPTKNKNLSENFDLPLPAFNNKVLGVIGFDLRHYLKVYKQIIWANRLAAGASFGNLKMIYYLGGLDNWITGPRFEKFDRNTPINTNNNYAFQTLATPVRGFKQNARNGDKFVVLNSELRVPIFAALINSPIRSEFIRNFQLVGFVDVGTAWEGLSPFADSNPLFNEEIPNTNNNDPSVIVRVKRYKTPVIMGFGPGVRTSIFGYFIRFDVAWGYDTGQVSKDPAYYFSLGLDF